jgi:uncharacterized OB-fold protein
MPDVARLKPLPVVTEVNRPFWDGCREGKLLLQFCAQCHTYQFYPRLYCMHCSATKLEWVEASGRGRIYSYTVIHRNKTPEFMQAVPYNVVIVELEEGPRMMANMMESDAGQLRVDLPVMVVFDRVNDEMSLPRFKPL